MRQHRDARGRLAVKPNEHASVVRRMQAAIVALLLGMAVALAVLAADVLVGPRIGSPLWSCVSSGQPTTAPVPPATGDPSTATIEELQRYSECTDRVGVPLALVAFVMSTAVIYRRASRRRI